MEQPMQKFEIAEGSHAGKQGKVEMIYYDYMHTGDSPDLVMGPVDNGEGYWKGTTENCRVFDDVS